jgi:hypothetical protein
MHPPIQNHPSSFAARINTLHRQDDREPAELEILKASCAVDMYGRNFCFTAKDIEEIVSYYDPNAYCAPLVLGHPKSDASSPAHGWVRKLRVGSSGGLLALVEGVSDAFKKMVQSGMYRHISASFWQPGHPGSPNPRAYALRHIGALGASAPAMPGLSTLEGLAFAAPVPLTVTCCDCSSTSSTTFRVLCGTPPAAYATAPRNRPLTAVEQLAAEGEQWRDYWQRQGQNSPR